MSLTSRLLDVAADFEQERKQEKAGLQHQINTLTETTAALEKEKKQQAALLDAQKERISKLEEELKQVQKQKQDELSFLDRDLLMSRFHMGELHEKLDKGLNVLRQVEEAMGKESTAVPVATLQSILQPWHGLSAGKKAAEQLKELKESSSRQERFSKSELFEAVECGRDDIVSSILNPTKAVLRRQAALPTAAAQQQSAALKEVLTKALWKASKLGYAAVANSLIAAGADLHKRSDHDGLMDTVLHMAAASGNLPLMKNLLDNYAAPGVPSSTSSSAGPQQAGSYPFSVLDRDSYDRTPLHRAAAGNHEQVVRVLLLAGADPEARDVHGHTPLELCKGARELVAAALTAAAQAASAKKLQRRHSTGEDDKLQQLEQQPDPFPHYTSGEMTMHPPATAARRALEDADCLYWNASTRANKLYTERQFERAIGAYSKALELAVRTSVSGGGGG